MPKPTENVLQGDGLQGSGNDLIEDKSSPCLSLFDEGFDFG
ncbi:MAG: hypothetical protein AVDCRST_MAG86-1368 [uncultured Truepera sp.]|uniref:Uncharacterized protein n=1 Tax=uncultured Truepera sp. TaxID=543023 RepID=A0A6J4V949_9DEIN|nr:MAG: hypothetical protein AVDCRST_MAG86-1368 [uncultured Truepera sp.]